MLHPSYNELMEYVNENAAPQENGEPLVQSRYTLVMAAAKRARQIVEARSRVQTSFTAADKPLSVAVKELYSGEVRILGENEEPDPVFPQEETAEAELSAEAGNGEHADSVEEEEEDAEATEDTDDFAVSGAEEISEDADADSLMEAGAEETPGADSSDTVAVEETSENEEGFAETEPETDSFESVTEEENTVPESPENA